MSHWVYNGQALSKKVLSKESAQGTSQTFSHNEPCCTWTFKYTRFYRLQVANSLIYLILWQKKWTLSCSYIYNNRLRFTFLSVIHWISNSYTKVLCKIQCFNPTQTATLPLFWLQHLNSVSLHSLSVYDKPIGVKN